MHPRSRPPTAPHWPRGWLENSPFVAHLGIVLESMEPDGARMRLPFTDALPTMGDVVHGGAISSLIDTTAAAAAWSGAQVPGRPKASTVGFTVNFLAPARAQGVSADARVIRRGAVTGHRGRRHGRRRHRGRHGARDLPPLGQ